MSIDISEYHAEDFQHMLFNFYECGDRDVFSCFPVLKNYPEFFHNTGKYLPKNKVLRYIGFCYDKGSPLQKLEDIVKKKVTAALLAGFEPLEGEKGQRTFSDSVDDMLRGNNTAVNLSIIRYCRLVRSRSFTVLAVGNEALHNTIKELMNYIPKGDDKLKETRIKMNMIAEAQEAAKNLDAMSVEFLSGDNAVKLNKMLYAVSDMEEEEYIKMTPEDFADKWMISHPVITAEVEKDDLSVSGE